MGATHTPLQVDTERAQEWKQVLDSSVAVLQDQLALHPQTGLLADFLVYNPAEKRYKPSEGKVLEKDTDGEYGWNSCRQEATLQLSSGYATCLISFCEISAHQLVLTGAGGRCHAANF